MLLEETYNLHREGYLEDEFIESRVALIGQKILLSKQLRQVYGSMKEEGIFSMSFIDWLDENLVNSHLYKLSHPNGSGSNEVGQK